ncbi:MAG: RecX family transcriptional regulator [Bryobacteraceae bacterium]|nr:RecX family transcriptional regulator [Bryobacteraceae bacterium]
MNTRQVRKLAGEDLFRHALMLLGRRALSASELRTKLARKAALAEEVEGILLRLKELGYLNDAQFAESYAAVRRDSGSFGKQRVLRDLRLRRVSAGIAEKAVGTAFENSDESLLILAWLKRKFKAVDLAEHLQVEKNLASAYRKLRYAGFSSAASIKVLKQFGERADELADSDLPEEREEQ